MKRKLLIAGPVALVLIVALVAFVAWPRGGTAVTEDEALERFRSGGSTTTSAGTPVTETETETTDPAASVPEPGVYGFATTGSESVKLGPLPAETRDYPASVPVTVVEGTDPGCFTVTVDLLAEHNEDTTYCAIGDGGLRLAGHQKRQVVGPMKPVATMTCDDDVLVSAGAQREVDRPTTSNDESRLSCSLTIDGGPAELKATVSGAVSTSESTVEVEGDSVDVVVIDIAYTLSGDLTGSWTETIQMSKENWMPLKIERTLDMQGLATFSESSDLTIEGLDPAT